MPLIPCLCPCATPLWVGGDQEEASSTGILRPSVAVSPSYSDTQVRVRKCILDDNFVRNSVAFCAKLIGVVGIGCFGRHGCLRAFPLARRTDSRQHGNMPLALFPCRCATALLAERIKEGGPLCGHTASHLLGFFMYSVAQGRVRKCVWGNSFMRNSVAFCAKLVVDVGVGCF